MHAASRFAVLLMALVGAGCASPSDPVPSTTAADTSGTVPPATLAPPTFQVLHFNRTFAWTEGHTDPVTGAPMKTGIQSDGGDAPTVPEGSTLLVADIEWACLSPNCVLQVSLVAPGGIVTPSQGTAEGPSPIHLELNDPEKGTWGYAASSTDVTLQVEGTIHFRVTAPS